MQWKAVVALAITAAIGLAGGSLTSSAHHETIAPSVPGESPPAVSAHAATADPTIFMLVDGIPGGSTRSGLERWIPVHGLSHDVVSPRDAASGLPTGKRQHKPFTITKEVDKATPLLAKALVNNEQIESVELRFYRPSVRSGKEEHFFTIELINASIVDNATDNDTGVATATRQHISIVYQKIIWTWVDGGITAEDDWETPVA